MKHSNKHTQHGFTVIELTIATSVFALVLLLVTYGLVLIGRTYYKGVTQVHTQDVARTVIEDISQAIQFAGAQPGIPDYSNSLGYASPTPPHPYDICIGTTRYSVNPGVELNDATPTHSLVKDTLPTGQTCDTSTPITNISGGGALSSSALELLQPNMRVAYLMVKLVAPNLYQIHVRIVYGDDDLLCSLTNPAALGGPNCGPTDPSQTYFNVDDLNCKNAASSQFCAVSDLTTTVGTRTATN